MNMALNRRGFLQTASATGAALSLKALAFAEPSKKAVSATPHCDKLGWRLSSTCYTFNSLSFFDAVEKTAGLSLRYVEGFSWQPVSKNSSEGRMNEEMPLPLRKEVKQRLDDQGVKLLSCYMADLPTNEAAARKKFEFGKGPRGGSWVSPRKSSAAAGPATKRTPCGSATSSTARR